MFVFIVRRIFSMIPTVFGAALLLFILFNLVGGDPTYIMLGKNASAQQITELRAQLHLDQPRIVQFGIYLKEIATFDFGLSYSSKQRISSMIARGVGPSLSVALPAFVITTLWAILIALVAAYYRGRFVDRLVVFLCVLGLAIPALAYILFGQFFLGYKLGWFPISGYEPRFPEIIHYVAMPVLIWVVVTLGVDVRFFRTAFLDETHQDYVRTARAKGLSEPKIFLKHVLKNSMIPIVTYVVIEIPFLIMGAILLENFFGIPGLGSLVIDAINNSDFPVLKAMATLTSLLYVFGQLLTDLIYAWVDPRVKMQ